MPLLLLGLAAALASSTLYNVGVALQAFEARQTHGDDSLHPSLIAKLAQRPFWLAGMACVIVGWVLQGASLLVAPLTIVQPTLAAGLVVLLLVGARFLGEPVGRREALAVLAVVVGVAGLALAGPRGASQPVSQALLVLALIVFAVIALATYVMTWVRGHSALVVVSAGLSYAWCGLSTNLAADALSRGELAVVGLWVVSTAIAGGLGLVSEMTALQTRPAIRVFPIVLVVQIVVAVVLAPALAGESWSATPLHGLPLLISLAVVATGTAMLASAPAVSAVLAGGRRD
jgi:drug/metabolite transporter (DMT)-like permease